jgi:hypothetical protein
MMMAMMTPNKPRALRLFATLCSSVVDGQSLLQCFLRLSWASMPHKSNHCFTTPVTFPEGLRDWEQAWQSPAQTPAPAKNLHHKDLDEQAGVLCIWQSAAAANDTHAHPENREVQAG